jgi:glycosyltransferase involved in cell wall biosynthesis
VFGIVARFFADGFIVASDRTRQYYLSGNSLGHRPTMEIQAPVDVSRFDRQQVTPALDVVEFGCPVLTTVGNVNHYKGLETFVRMAHRLNQLVTKPVAFAIVGPVFDNQQAYYDGLVRLCRELGVDNVHFLGFRNDVREILKASAVYICSSNFEASPISIWEAMAMGMPIVSTDVGDVRDILEQNECGRVVDVADHEQLASHAAELLGDASLRERMGLRARDVAVNQLDLTICANRHAEFYRSVTGRSAPNNQCSVPS